MALVGRREVVPAIRYRGLYTRFLLPVPNCEGWFWLGGSLERSIINGAKGGRKAILVGSPPVNEAYLSFVGGNNFLEMPFKDTVAGTYFVIAKSTDVNDIAQRQPTFIGATDGSDEVTSINVVGQTSVRISVGMSDGVTVTLESTVVNVPSVSDWRCYIAEFDATERRIFDMTAGTVSGLGTHTGSRALSASPVTIGGGLGGGIGTTRRGTSNIAAAGYWPRRITAAERVLLYETVAKPILARLGLSI